MLQQRQQEMMSALFHIKTVNDFFCNIPDSILAEILKTLPVKSLLRCMCIQKSWYHLIKTPFFVNLHFNYHHHNNIASNHNNDLNKYLLFRLPQYSKLLCLRYDDEDCKEFQKLELHPVIRLREGTCWQATSCGLICVFTIYNAYRYQGDIYLWNPLIQKCKTLPVLDLSHIFETCWTALAFGYVPSIYDYQVVRIVTYVSNGSRSILICVYSLNTNSWKTKTIQDHNLVRIIDQFESVSVNGISCWRATNNKTTETVETDAILYYDTLNDILGTISLPQVCKHKYNHSLHQFGQSVALFVQATLNDNYNMWILKQDSIDDFFWEKKATISLGKHLPTVVLGLRNNCELILSQFYEPRLVSFNTESKKIQEFFSSWKQWSMLKPYDLFYHITPFIVHPFVAGLVLLDTD